MIDNQIIRIDGIKWWIVKSTAGNRLPIPLCPIHDLRLRPIPPIEYDPFYKKRMVGHPEDSRELECAEGLHKIGIPRKFNSEKRYIVDRIDAKVFKGMKVINLDNESVPVAESRVNSKNGKYFVKSQLMESKRGIQLVIYAGEKGKNEKTQIFVEPIVKRLDFDRKDLHPDEVFLEVTAKFNDGSSHAIKKDAKKVKNGKKK